MDWLFHKQRSNVTVIKRLKKQQGLARCVTLVRIKDDAELRSCAPHSFNAVCIITQITSHLDFDPGNSALNNVLRQVICMFGRDHWYAHICFDTGGSATQEDVQRDIICSGERVEDRYLHARA